MLKNMTRMRLIFLVLLALGSCSKTEVIDLHPDLVKDRKSRPVLVATSRQKESDGTYLAGRSNALSFLEYEVSIPDEYETGRPGYNSKPNPTKQLVLGNATEVDTKSAFLQKVTHYGQTAHEETVIFVHGFNTNHYEAALRGAQTAEAVQSDGVSIVYSWPSQGSPYAYAYDSESALIARDGLEKLILDVSKHPVGPLKLVAHSMGSMLLMETIRQIEAKYPGWLAREVELVTLVAPDIDVDLFRAQFFSIEKLPKRFVLFLAESDLALNVSQRLRGERTTHRLGNTGSIKRLLDLPITIIDLTEFRKRGFANHFLLVNSPELIATLGPKSGVTRPDQFVRFATDQKATVLHVTK